MTRFAVTSPPWRAFEFNLTVALDLPEYQRQYVEVEADTPGQARVLAVQAFRKRHGCGGSVAYCEYEQSPFAGLEVLNIDALEACNEKE